MATKSRKVSPALKRKLIEEAGFKCANPGCSCRRVQLHHIKEWAVYKTHDEKDMIALCPSCHDAVHHDKTLPISDEQLRQWKTIARSGRPEVAHVFVEPSEDVRLLIGTISVATAKERFKVFELGGGAKLALAVKDGDLLHVSADVFNGVGVRVLKVVDNVIRVQTSQAVEFSFRLGRAMVTVPVDELFVPSWLRVAMRHLEPKFATGATIPVIDLEVILPGYARVEGIWLGRGKRAVVVTKEGIYFCDASGAPPRALEGDGFGSCLLWGGREDEAIFQFK